MGKSEDLQSAKSKVYLVGAGPGDPGLVTLRAAELIGSADAIVYDYLVDDSILGLAKSDVVLIDVGKRPSRPLPQSEVTAELIRAAKLYGNVVRLKGGDPFVFGRGAEEAEALVDEGIPFEVVPGVTSAIAVPAYAGIPVTHRGIASSFTVLTGHSRDAGPLQYDWTALARVGGTLIFLMGVAHRAEISNQLISAGMDPKSPVSAVIWGTRPDQWTVMTDLEGLAKAQISSPAVIVIGAVNRIRNEWFKTGPLVGLKVVVTRAEGVATSRIEQRLSSLGASVIAAPSIEITDPVGGGSELVDAVGYIERFDWIVFTSQNAVDRFFGALDDTRRLGAVRIAAVGTGTEAAVRAHGVGVDLVPTRAVADALVADFPSGSGAVLFPKGDRASSVVEEGLSAKGWLVSAIVVYRTVPSTVDVDHVLLRGAQLITFTSGTTVEGFLAKYGADLLPSVIGSIGPVTSSVIKNLGLQVGFEAKRHDLEGLCEAVVDWWNGVGAK